MAANSTASTWFNSSSDWVKDNVDFTAAMLIVGGVFLLVGLCLGFCIWRYPSYDTPENFERGKRLGGKSWLSGKRSRKHSTQAERSTSVSSIESVIGEVGTFERLPSHDSTFQRPTIRLPNPGSAPPPGRLPPLVPFGMVNGSRPSMSDASSNNSKLNPYLRGGSSQDVESLDDDAILDDVDGQVRRVKILNANKWHDEVTDLASVGGMSSVQF